MERGVTSRARKAIEGRETVADPRYGGRPDREHSKWQPPRPARPRRAPRRAPAPAPRTPGLAHRVRVSLPEHLYEKLLDVVEAERSLRRDVRLSPSDKIAELVRDYEPPADVAALIGARRRPA